LEEKNQEEVGGLYTTLAGCSCVAFENRARARQRRSRTLHHSGTAQISTTHLQEAMESDARGWAGRQAKPDI